MSFQIDTVMDIRRDEVAPPVRPFWARLFSDGSELEVFHYTVLVSIRGIQMTAGDGIIMFRDKEQMMLRVIDSTYGAYRLTTTYPTTDLLNSTDFKNATYVLTDRSFAERG